MGYLFTAASAQYMTAAVPAVTYPFTMACWVWLATVGNHHYAISVVDKTASQLHAGLYPFSDGKLYFTVKGTTANDGSFGVTYTATTWLPVIAVAHSATNRDLYVGGNSGNRTVDTGPLVGLTTCLMGARWNAVPSGPQEFYQGKVAEAVLALGEEWDSTQRDAYIAGTEGHVISGVTPDLYANLLRNPSAPNGVGTPFTLVNGPVLTDHPPLLTGQNKKRLTITGTHADVVATLASPNTKYTPDPGYLGGDTLTVLVTDATALTATANVVLTVVAPPMTTGATTLLHRRRRLSYGGPRT